MFFKSHIGLRRSLAVILSVTSLITGCIREDLGNCPAQTALQITVRSDESGGKFTPVEGAAVYLFDHNRRYITQIPVSGREIENNTPVNIPVSPLSKTWAVIWGNIKDNENITGLSEGKSIDEVILDLRKEDNGYAKAPDGLFYGIKQLSGKSAEEIIISPKTARIRLTAKGLSADTSVSGHYFTLESHYDGYAFSGAPHPENIRIKMEGEFDGEHDLVTPEPYDIIHYPLDTRQGEEPHCVINLWRVATGGKDTLLTSAEKDSDGGLIIPRPGKTTNILIYFKNSGEIIITVVITDWNEVYQWNEW